MKNFITIRQEVEYSYTRFGRLNSAQINLEVPKTGLCIYREYFLQLGNDIRCEINALRDQCTTKYVNV